MNRKEVTRSYDDLTEAEIEVFLEELKQGSEVRMNPKELSPDHYGDTENGIFLP
jgi:hypothetical protein